MNLAEKHRPKTWDEVVGQEKAIARIRQLAQRGLSGRAFWISGPSGAGKTTIARLLAAEIADPLNVTEIDATALTPAALREVESSMQYYGWGKGARNGKAYILNESHGLRKDAIRQLLVLLERLPAHVMVVFTTTCDGQALFEDYDDASPLLSRCVQIPLARRNLASAFAERARQIATAEGLNGRPIEEYVRLAKECRNNLRAMLQAVDAGDMLV